MPYELNSVSSLLAGGNAILLLGDLGATADGNSSLGVARLEALAALGFPDTTQMPLNTILQALYARTPEIADRIIASHLSRTVADRRDLVRIIQAPWERIYSVSGLNLTNIDFEGLNHPIVHQYAHLPRAGSAGATLLVDEALGADREVRDFIADVGATSEQGIWRREMCAKTLTVPTVAVALESDAQLWDRLECRDMHSAGKPGDMPDLPPCILVVARIRPEDHVMSLTTGVVLVEATPHDLAGALSPGDMKLKEGHRLLARSRNAAKQGVGVHQVSALVKDLELPTSWDFLRGYDPSWADVVYKRPVRLSILKKLRAACSFESGQRNTVVVRTRAGAGKTTALMMFAHDLNKQGYNVAWLDRSATQRSQQLIEEVDDLDPDCVIMDDADIFGETTPKLLRILNKQGGRLVVASVRTTRDRMIGYIPNAKYVDESPLTDAELRSLHQVLSDAGLLGALQGIHPMATRLEHLSQLCQRDLLAALIEIVTGKRFEERIQEEFAQLSPLEREAYQTLAVFVANVGQARALKKEELLECVSEDGSFAKCLAAIESLLHQRLLVQDADGLRVRHRSIARALVDGLPKAEVARSLGRLLRHYAGRAHAILESSDPQRRTMVALLSHSLMVGMGLPVEDVRRLYSDVQGLLRNDFHYWLQRGAFETERGDEELARTYLKSARSCPGGMNDYKVITESGLLALRRARTAPLDAEAQKQAGNAINEMLGVTRQHGASSPHTFKILAEDGWTFVESCTTLSEADRRELMTKLDTMVATGLAVCRDNTVAMAALEAYAKRREGITATPPPPTYPMPQIKAKPGPFTRSSRK